MFKQVLIAGAVLTATSGLALANGGTFTPVPETPHHTHTFYVGASISRDHAQYDVQHNMNMSYPDLSESKDFNKSSTGVGGELFAGYGVTMLDHYYVALEGFGDISSMDSKAHFNAVNNTLGAAAHMQGQIEQEWSAGVSLLPGIKITDSTLLYGRVGWIISEIDAKINQNMTFNGLTASINKSHDDEENGIQLGVGMEAMVTQNVGVRGEWDWSHFENINMHEDHDFGFTSVHGHAKLDNPELDQFKFGLDWHFA